MGTESALFKIEQLRKIPNNNLNEVYMKRTGKILLIFVAVLALFSSCLKVDDDNIPTREEEQLNLTRYIYQLRQNDNIVDSTDLGIYYITMEEGTGDFPEYGDTLSLIYAGYFLDGTLFDTSLWHDSQDSTYSYVHGEKAMIPGWENGMSVINKDAKVQLIIPSDLAYGANGAGRIGPYQTLIFVIKMKDIKPGNKNEE